MEVLKKIKYIKKFQVSKMKLYFNLMIVLFFSSLTFDEKV